MLTGKNHFTRMKFVIIENQEMSMHHLDIFLKQVNDNFPCL